MIISRLRAVLALAVGPAIGCANAQVPAATAPPMRADTAALRRTLDSLSAAHRGVVGYAVHNLDTGERLERRGDEPFPTASLIKVPILVALFGLIEKGEIALDDRLVVNRVDKVPGSGILQHLHDGITITVRDAAWLMVTVSDNTATNLILDKVAMRRVWTAMEALGLPRTKVHSRTFQRFTSVAMDSSVKYGFGVSTPNEMARLFTLLAQGRAVSARADSTMLAMLAANPHALGLHRYLDGIHSPRKSGEVDASRTECGLLHLRSRVAVCVFTRENQDQRWVPDNEAQLLLANMGRAVAQGIGTRD